MRELTSYATRDDLSEQDYLEIIEDNRTNWREFARKIAERITPEYRARWGKPLSFAYWNKVAKGDRALSQRAKDELRCLLGFPLTPVAVADVVSENVDPDATVLAHNGVGPESPATLMVLAHRDDKIIVVGEGDGGPPETLDQIPLATRPQGNPHPPRRNRERRNLSLPPAVFDQANAVRNRLGLTWSEFMQKASLLIEQGEADEVQEESVPSLRPDAGKVDTTR